MDICRPGICTTCEQQDSVPTRSRRFRSDKDVFELLVRRHHTAVATYALAVTRNRWQADEAVQDTFVRAWKYLDSFRGDGCFEGWLLRICRNCISTNARKTSQEVSKEFEDSPVSSDSRTEVMLMLASLPLPQREALTLCRLLGYSYEGAAQILGVPVGTIRSRVARGRASLEKLLRQGEIA